MGSKSEKTRRRILDAAASVLSQKGYAGMRLGEVADVAGVQTPAIYYHFASRDELVEEVMWSGAHDVRLHVEDAVAALPAGSAPLDRIMTAVDAHLRYELEISDYATASIRNARHVPDSLRERPAEEESRYSHFWRDLFDAAKQDGTIRDDLDITTFRMLLLGAMNWVVEWWRPEVRSLAEVIGVAQDMVRRTITAG
ncbi:TetR family transcriptional regulator [Nocardioides albertanoniae]|uniref:TetR family transcriptional regulator n=1 Tax=Nocardioides albertanoniae TaxID=1175486 RepID=A0A543A878_9ACTN|nr:TetR/AcrR family transcriptional regulator [Nocardioides albertanoniae]TQL68803.1 TetR family transcriptional regulator [Nocardioides albertanoniae]